MAEEMKFENFCLILDKIACAVKDKKLKLLNKLFSSLRESSNSTGASFYPFLRLLLPSLDSGRVYGVREHNLAKTYIRILCLPKDGLDANKLLKFRSPTAGRSAGDFADVAYWVLKNRCRNGGKLSVKNVNSYLDRIASLHANHKPRGVDDELTEMLLHMSAEEQKWLIRMLLKDLRLGVAQVSILNVIHPDARELYDVSNSLVKVCEVLQDPEKRLHEIEVCLFEPCRPMLSERCDILKVDAIISKVPFYYVEKKHDGERFQIHVNKGLFCYYSRNGKDEYTDNYGKSAQMGTLTPLLAKQLHSNVQTCILDGEMMAWNPNLKCYVSKGQKVDVKHLRKDSVHRPCFCTFDVLMLNGEVLTNKPLQNRIEILKQIFTPLEGVFMDTPQKIVKTSVEVVEALNDAIDRQEEGLILKNPNSIYKPAAKTGGGWYKIKPEYTVGLTDELDLLIMGGYFGGGRKTKISHFLVGVAVSPDFEGSNPKVFHSVGRVGSGYSVEELAELLEKLSPHWKPVKGTEMPHGLVWTKERPDVWIEPQNSQILQVKATEIVQSDLYKTGYTLRFPRVEKVRYDKKWSECCNTQDFDNLRLLNCGKLASRHVNPSELSNFPTNKRKRVKAAPVVGREYQPADLTTTPTTGSLFNGREICVLSGDDKVSKQDLEKYIHEQGGTVVQYRGPETYCVVAGKKDFRFRNLLDKGDVDIVTVDWLLRVLDEGAILKWQPQDLWAMSSRTQEDMEMRYDHFYDSYNSPTNPDALKLSLQKVADQGLGINLLPSEMGDLDVELFSGTNEFAVFRCCTACFITSDKEETAFHHDLFKAMFRFQGGRVSELESPDVTHVVIDAHNQKDYGSLKKLNQFRPKKFYIVTYDWIESCWVSRSKLHEQDFHPMSHLYCS